MPQVVHPYQCQPCLLKQDREVPSYIALATGRAVLRREHKPQCVPRSVESPEYLPLFLTLPLPNQRLGHEGR